MKRDRYSDNSGIRQKLSLKSNLSILLVGLPLFLLLISCGKISQTFVTRGEYTVPPLPRAELIPIRVDMDGGWIYRLDRLALWIDGLLSLEEKFDEGEGICIKEILISPGKHDLSVLIIYPSFHEAKPSTRQIMTSFSADVQIGASYLLCGEFSLGADGELCFES